LPCYQDNRCFPEETIAKENERINCYRDELRRLKTDLEAECATAKKSIVDIGDIQKACELVKNNLADLSIEDKRSAFEVLNVRVGIDGNNITLQGSIPISDCSTATTQSLPHLSPAHLPSP